MHKQIRLILPCCIVGHFPFALLVQGKDGCAYVYVSVKPLHVVLTKIIDRPEKSMALMFQEQDLYYEAFLKPL